MGGGVRMQVSIKLLSETALHPDYRWDGEYICFEPYKNNSIKYVPIGDTLKSSQYGLSIAMNEEGNGVKIYRMNEISNMMCDRNILKYAPITAVETQAYKLNDRDVLFNRTNSQVFVGRTGIFKSFSKEPMVFASYLVRIVPDEDKVTPEYLTTYLNTKYGILDVKRRARISINQSNVNAEELKRVEIPLVRKELQLLITSAFEEAFELIQNSESTFKEAENILLSELGLNNWQPKHQRTFIKNYSDTQEAGRIDAEYYQPKYDEIIQAIKSYSGGWDTLGNLVHVKKCIEVGSGEYLNEGVPFVRVSNISPFEITEEKYISEKLYNELTPVEKDAPFEKSKNHQPKQGEILFSKDGTPGIAYYLKDEPPKMIPSGGILRLKNKTDKVNNEYLTLVLNSLLTQEQVNRDVGGSIILHWRPDQVKQAIIPVLSDAKQQEIQQKVTESFNLRKQSKHLLESAKKAVEMAIEQNEQTAIKWLQKQMQSIGVTDANGL